MFEKIQHIGYLTPDLDAAIAWFEKSFGATNAGGGPLGKSYAVPSGGRNAYVRFGQAEAEIIEPEDKTGLSGDVLTMHHVGYLVSDILRAIDQLTAQGFKFAADKPFTNVMGQQLLYFDASTTNGVLMHLTQPPEQLLEKPLEHWRRDVLHLRRHLVEHHAFHVIPRTRAGPLERLYDLVGLIQFGVTQCNDKRNDLGTDIDNLTRCVGRKRQRAATANDRIAGRHGTLVPGDGRGVSCRFPAKLLLATLFILVDRRQLDRLDLVLRRGNVDFVLAVRTFAVLASGFVGGSNQLATLRTVKFDAHGRLLDWL